MSNSPKFTKVYPLPAYEGPTPVYRCSFPWAGAVDCYVRRRDDGVWETAPVGYQHLQHVRFVASPIAGASHTRYDAAMRHDYHFNRLASA